MLWLISVIGIVCIKLPATVTVVYHLLCHTTVYRYIFTGNKSCHIGAKIKHHVRNIRWVAHPAGRLLYGVCALVHGIGIVYPAGRYRVNAHPTREADRERVSKRGNTALCRRVALGFGLAHSVA